MTTHFKLSALSRLLASLRPISIFQDPEPTLPKPRIPIAESNGGIRYKDISDPAVPVQALINAYPQIQINDFIELFWNERPANSVLVNQGHIDQGSITLDVPSLAIQDGMPPVHYLVTSPNGTNQYKSFPLDILVKTDVPGGTDPIPSTPEVNENLLAVTGVPELIDDSNAGNIVATVPSYQNMTKGDKIKLSWGGYFIEHELKEEGVNNPVPIPVPRETIEKAGAGPVVIEYEIRDIVNNWSLWSLKFTPDVEVGAGLLREPDALDVVGGKLDLVELGDNDARIRVRVYADMAPGDEVALSWFVRPPTGSPIEYSDEKIIDSDSDGLPVEFLVPNATAKASAGGTVAVKYSVTSNLGVQNSRRTTFEVIGQVQKLPEPSIREALGTVLDPANIPQGGATATVPAWPGAASGDKLELFINARDANGAPSSHYDFKDISGGQAGHPVDFLVPRAFFLPLVNGSLEAYYRVKGEDSYPLTLDVVEQGGAELPAPSVNGVEADGVLDPDAVPNGTKAMVPQYPGKAVNDRIYLTWAGLPEASYTDDINVTEDNLGTPIGFDIAYSPYIIGNLNSSVAVSYQVMRAGGGSATSATLPIQVRRKAGEEFVAPSVLQAPTGTLDPIDAVDGAIVRVKYDGMLPSDTMAVAWIGNSQADTWESDPKNGSAFGQVDFSVPVSVVAASQGKLIEVRYAVVRNDQPPKPSLPLELTVGVLSQDHLPLPVVPEAPDKILDMATFQGNAKVTVAPWRLIALAQRYWIKVSGTNDNSQPYSFYVAFNQPVTTSEVGGGLDWPMLRSELQKLKHEAPLTVEVSIAFDPAQDETAARKLLPLILTLRKPATIIPGDLYIPKAPARRLNVQTDFYRDEFLDVQVLVYEGMAPGQSIVLQWEGPLFTWRSDPQRVDTPSIITFKVPRLEVLDAIGYSVKIHYIVNDTIPSAPYTLNIDSQGMSMPPPQFFDQGGGSYAVSIYSPDQQTDHTGRVRWTGVITRDSAEQHLQTGEVEYFQIPTAWINENRGREVLINYTIYRGNNEPFRFSQVLRLKL